MDNHNSNPTNSLQSSDALLSSENITSSGEESKDPSQNIQQVSPISSKHPLIRQRSEKIIVETLDQNIIYDPEVYEPIHFNGYESPKQLSTPCLSPSKDIYVPPSPPALFLLEKASQRALDGITSDYLSRKLPATSSAHMNTELMEDEDTIPCSIFFKDEEYQKQCNQAAVIDEDSRRTPEHSMAELLNFPQNEEEDVRLPWNEVFQMLSLIDVDGKPEASQSPPSHFEFLPPSFYNEPRKKSEDLKEIIAQGESSNVTRRNDHEKNVTFLEELTNIPLKNSCDYGCKCQNPSEGCTESIIMYTYDMVQSMLEFILNVKVEEPSYTTWLMCIKRCCNPNAVCKAAVAALNEYNELLEEEEAISFEYVPMWFWEKKLRVLAWERFSGITEIVDLPTPVNYFYNPDDNNDKSYLTYGKPDSVTYVPKTGIFQHSEHFQAFLKVMEMYDNIVGGP